MTTRESQTSLRVLGDAVEQRMLRSDCSEDLTSFYRLLLDHINDMRLIRPTNTTTVVECKVRECMEAVKTYLVNTKSIQTEEKPIEYFRWFTAVCNEILLDAKRPDRRN